MRFTVEDQLYNHGFRVLRVMLSPEGILITMVVVGESEAVVGRFPRGACPTHFLREIRFRERESSYEHLFLLIYRRNRRRCQNMFSPPRRKLWRRSVEKRRKRTILLQTQRGLYLQERNQRVILNALWEARRISQRYLLEVNSTSLLLLARSHMRLPR